MKTKKLGSKIYPSKAERQYSVPFALFALLAAAFFGPDAFGDAIITLHAFSDQLPGGGGMSPRAPLLQGADGDFYGTTAGSFSGGSVFKMTSAGVETTLYSFTNGLDGDAPLSALVLGNDGNFYGTTSGLRSTNGGTVFKISPAGVLTTLCTFGGVKGSNIYAGLLPGGDGYFYGTAGAGGARNSGTFFQVSSNGVLSVLYTFTGLHDGKKPLGQLTDGGNGYFYGTTYSGGDSGAGTIFRITPGGSLTNLHTFSGGNDGSGPYAGLYLGGDGNFYGTTQFGGASGGGVAFKLTPAGAITVLHSFTGNGEGEEPAGTLAPGGDGNLYGTTVVGGANAVGTVFRLTPDGLLTTLYSFTGGGDGANPYTGLIPASDGKLYGTTASGALQGGGTVFRLVLPAPFVTNVTSVNGTVNFTWNASPGGGGVFRGIVSRD